MTGDVITIGDPRWIRIAQELNKVHRRWPESEEVLRLVELALNRGAPGWRDFATSQMQTGGTMTNIELQFPPGTRVQLRHPADAAHEGQGKVVGVRIGSDHVGLVLVRWPRCEKTRRYLPEQLRIVGPDQRRR